MADDAQRPTLGLGTKLALLVAVIVVAWLVFNVVGGALRWILSMLGYLIVAVIAFALGRFSAGPRAD